MGTIGSWWISSVGALPEEVVQASYYANYLRQEGRPLGGKLYITDERLLFLPHLIDAYLSGEQIAFAFSTGVTSERIDPDAAESVEGPGSGTERLRVSTREGAQAFFVVNDLDAATSAITDALDAFDRES